MANDTPLRKADMATPDIRTITTTQDLAAFCELAKTHPYVTLDTEFLRERTYYSKLCLIQMALPPASTPKVAGGPAVLVDPLADGLSLEPLYDLFRHQATVKVFHAARQDLEIFYHDAGVLPDPLFYIGRERADRNLMRPDDPVALIESRDPELLAVAVGE